MEPSPSSLSWWGRSSGIEASSISSLNRSVPWPFVGRSLSCVGKMPGWEVSELAAVACRDALTQAGLTFGDVDGLFFCHGTDTLGGLSFAQYLGIRPKIVDNSRTGGSALRVPGRLSRSPGMTHSI